MLVRDLMSPDPLTIDGAATLGDALSLMRMYEIRELPVMVDDRLVGMLTDRDLRGALGPGVGDGDVSRMDELRMDDTVDRIMSEQVLAVMPDTDVIDALRLLLEHRFGALPVVDEDFAPVGVFSATDVLGWALAHLEENPAAN